MTSSILRKGIGLSAAIAGLLAVAPAANAVDIEISGHVNRMIRAADNDANGSTGFDNAGSDIQHLDNGADQSRIRLTGLQDIDNGHVGFDVELRLEDTSDCYDIKDDSPDSGKNPGAVGTGARQGDCGESVEFSRADVFFEGDMWGKVSFGKGDSASRGSDRADLSGTDLVMNYDNRRNAALSFFTDDIVGSQPTFTYGDVFRMYEGDRSENRARYDSPVWAGFKFAVSNSNNDKYAIGATYAFGEGDDDIQVRVAAGFTDLDQNLDQFGFDEFGNAGTDTLASVSASVLFIGFNLTGGFGTADSEVSGVGNKILSEDQNNWHVKFGYRWDNIAVAVRYVDAADVGGVDGLDGDSIGIGAQWAATDWLDVYGGLELATLDDDPRVLSRKDAEDLSIGTIGLRVSF